MNFRKRRQWRKAYWWFMRRSADSGKLFEWGAEIGVRMAACFADEHTERMKRLERIR